MLKRLSLLHRTVRRVLIYDVNPIFGQLRSEGNKTFNRLRHLYMSALYLMSKTYTLPAPHLLGLLFLLYLCCRGLGEELELPWKRSFHGEGAMARRGDVILFPEYVCTQDLQKEGIPTNKTLPTLSVSFFGLTNRKARFRLVLWVIAVYIMNFASLGWALFSEKVT